MFTCFKGKWSKSVWDDTEDTHTTETFDCQDRGGCGEGVIDPGEGEVISRTETYPGQTTRSRSGRTITDLSTNAQRKDKTNEGNILVRNFM